MPNHWILKSDAATYGFDRLQQDGRTVWNGVSNPLALRHIRNMAPGDPLLIYHSGAGKELVGLARVVGVPYQDPSQKDPRLTVVDIEADRRLPNTVSLATIKADPFFSQLALVRMPRLSVIPVPEPQWNKLLALGGASLKGRSAARRGKS